MTVENNLQRSRTTQHRDLSRRAGPPPLEGAGRTTLGTGLCLAAEAGVDAPEGDTCACLPD